LVIAEGAVLTGSVFPPAHGFDECEEVVLESQDPSKDPLPTGDKEAAIKAALSSREPFVRLLAKHESAIRAFIYSLLPNWADTEEVLQETSLIVWRKFDQFTPGTNFLRWACRVAELEVRQFRSKKHHDRLQFGDSMLEQIAAIQTEENDLLDLRRRALADCVKRLNDRDKSLLASRYVDNAPGTKIATDKGKPVEAIYKRLQRIRRKLYDCVSHTVALEFRQ